MPCLHIFGGGTDLVAHASSVALAAGWSASLRTSPRLWDSDHELAARLQRLGVQVYVGVSLADVMAQGNDVEDGDVALSFGAPWIFPADWISQWQRRAYNYHPRRLPENRGGGGSSWPILMGERMGNVCFHEITPGIDDGPIVARAGVVFREGVETPAEQDAVLSGQAVIVLDEWLPRVLEGHSAEGTLSQPEYLSTYWPRLHSGVHGWVDWRWTQRQIIRFIKAFGFPHPGGRTLLRGVEVALRGPAPAESKDFHPFQSGLIYRIQGERLFVAAVGGGVSVCLASHPPGRRLEPRLGDRLYTPAELLERALATRVSYLPSGEVKMTSSIPNE